MRTLRIVPDLRSAVVEERPPGQVLMFTSRRTDADPALLADPAVIPFSWRALARAARDPQLALLEVAEPLWLGEWRRALRCLALARVVRAVPPRRRRVLVATYAIENVDARERLRASCGRGPFVDALASRVRILALGVSLSTLDAVAFGTSGAAENYRRTFGWALTRTRHAVLPPRIDGCRVCGPDAAPRGPREATVLFLGTPGPRKGFDVLLAAWEDAGAAARGWRLVVADPGEPVPRALPAGVSVHAPDRAGVHALLRRAAVVAMPSVRRPGWREQIGLPLLEGLAHGAVVVTTTETGLAADLRGHPRVVLAEPGDAADLAAGLRRAMDGPPPTADAPPAHRSVEGYTGHTKTDVLDWWLAAPGRDSADRARP